MLPTCVSSPALLGEKPEFKSSKKLHSEQDCAAPSWVPSSPFPPSTSHVLAAPCWAIQEGGGCSGDSSIAGGGSPQFLAAPPPPHHSPCPRLRAPGSAPASCLGRAGLAGPHHRLHQAPAPRVLRLHGGAPGCRNGNGPLRVPAARAGWCPSIPVPGGLLLLPDLSCCCPHPAPYSTANTSSCTSARRTPRTATRCWRP